MSDLKYSDSPLALADRKELIAGGAPFLFAVLEYGEFPELLRAADVLHARFGRPIVFLFLKRGYRRMKEDSRLVIERGFAWIDPWGQFRDTIASDDDAFPAAASQARHEHVKEPGAPLRAPNRAIWRRLFALAALPFYSTGYFGRDMVASMRVSARDVANFWRDLRRFRRRYREVEKLLIRYRPALLVTGQDPPGTELPMLLIAAGHLKIPRLMAPFAMFSLRETAEFGWAKGDYQVDASAINALVAKIFPHWVLAWKGRRFLRLQGYRALALECAGLVHGMPWTPLSEPVEAITAESKVAATALAAMGIDQRRISVVGSPVHDRLKYHILNRVQIRQRLWQEHRLDPSRPLLLCGWPANIFPWLAGRTIQYADYAALARAWASALADVRDQFGVNVIISVHPKTLPEEYQEARDRGLPYRLGGTDELVGACDFFTTLNGSSVTAWAIACGLPVLLFDCFETNYTDFDGVPGCVRVQTEEQFVTWLKLLCSSAEKREKLAAAQRQVADDWGRLDGHAGRRLGDLAKSLVGSTE